MRFKTSILNDIEPLLGEVIGDQYSTYIRSLVARDLRKKLKTETDPWLRFLMLDVLVNKLLFRTNKHLPSYKIELSRLKKRYSAQHRREVAKFLDGA